MYISIIIFFLILNVSNEPIKVTTGENQVSRNKQAQASLSDETWSDDFV